MSTAVEKVWVHRGDSGSATLRVCLWTGQYDDFALREDARLLCEFLWKYLPARTVDFLREALETKEKTA